MNFKKVFAGIAAASLAVSMLATSSVSAAKTGDTAIDFEDGDFSFCEIGKWSGGGDAKLSVVSFNGSKQLKIDVAKEGQISQLAIRLATVVAPEDLVKIAKLEADVTFENKDGSPVGWHGGQVAIDTQNAKPSWGSTTSYALSDEDATLTAPTMKVTRNLLLPTSRFKDGAEAPTFHIQSYSSDTVLPYVWYVDNVKFYDEKGNLIPITIATAETEAAAADTTAAPAETAAATEAAADAGAEVTEAPAATEAPATTAAPAATEVPATGNPVAAGAIAVVMLAAAGVAVVSKRK